ncbi:MAG: hydantoinase/oxoprolinase family protein, partial [Proteobacteria bacterium]|nr:hydantoinase/oxoprolinase family protein [Pseudomonadota bacterium]
MKQDLNPQIRLAADIGGTFTDIAAFDERSGLLSFGKSLSTPEALVGGITDGIAKTSLELNDVDLFLHGSTVAINTVLERTGSRAALITTRGFRDIYEIGRINRPDSYDLYFRKHRPLIERALRFEVAERITATGEVLRPLDDQEILAIARKLEAQGVEAVAILFMHSYHRPDHEIRAKELIEKEYPDLFVTASHELAREYREFERTSTVAANAYIGPKVKQYINGIEGFLSAAEFRGKFLVVQSTGGLFEPDRAKRECVRMLESGPVSGVIGSQALCRAIGIENAIAFDMGGTTAKAGVVYDGEALTAGSALIGPYAEGLPIQVPMIDIFEVGTGGGSIARVEAGGAVRVGPQSAGAVPGPVCYGRGGESPTVTDANLLLGRLAADRFLGGEMQLDKPAAERAMQEKIAGPLGLSETQAAEGILRIANASMSNTVRGVTTERGLMGVGFAMVAYGGAGPLHAASLARELGIERVVIPPAPGHFSAFGMLFADVRYDFVQSWFCSMKNITFDELEERYAAMETEGHESVRSVLPDAADIVVNRSADMRYVGQEHAVTVALPRALFAAQNQKAVKQQFDRIHEIRYGFGAADEE